MLEHETKFGTALYLCLEDSFERIQKRLYELTDIPTDNLHFAIAADTIDNGLENQIEKFKTEHSDLRACSVSFYVRIFEHNFVDYKEKIRRHTDVW